MITLVVSHEVANFDTWKKAFDEHSAQRDAVGFTINGLYQDANNASMVTLIGEADSEETVNNFMSNSEMQETMKNSGVISAPDVKILRKAN